jgi:hypothetical protein
MIVMTDFPAITAKPTYDPVSQRACSRYYLDIY